MRKGRRKSGFADSRTNASLLDFAASGLGQTDPKHYPRRDNPDTTRSADPLGEPLHVCDVARLIGCSTWTVRRRLLRRGLPYVRLGNGRLVFYRNQVIAWVLEIQKERRM